MQLQNDQYNSLYAQYNEAQLKNSRLLLARKKEIQEAIPEWDELDHIIADLSVKMAKSTFDGTKADVRQLKHDISVITRKKEVLLTQHGYPADYLQPFFDCPDCRDTG